MYAIKAVQNLMAAESMLSKRPVLRFTAALLSLLNTIFVLTDYDDTVVGGVAVKMFPNKCSITKLGEGALFAAQYFVFQ